MILVIDNYDSFTYNLVHLIGNLGHGMKIYRNDEIDMAGITALNPTHIVISPGPGRPENAGVTQEIISTFAEQIPIMGVCLGHQAIGQVFGAKVDYAEKLIHGKATPVFHYGKSIFNNLPNPLNAGRYHSLTVKKEDMPDSLEILAYSGDGQVMAIRHKKFPVYGLQFHPESILTDVGELLMENFLFHAKEEADVRL